MLISNDTILNVIRLTDKALAAFRPLATQGYVEHFYHLKQQLCGAER